MSELKNIKDLDAVSGNIFGGHNTVRMVNPYKCFFIAEYADGTVVEGNNLFDTGWADLREGITVLHYKLSTGHIITIPKFKAYMHLVEVSQSIQNDDKLFHAVNIKGLGDNEVFNYKIILKQDNVSKHNIGDVILSKDDKVLESPYWKMAAA